MTITNDDINVFIDSKKLEAYLDGAWVDITADLLQRPGVSYGGGIRGQRATDIMGSSSPMRFVLKNHTGKYYPDGPNALAGWGENVPIRFAITYDGTTYMQYYGRAKLEFTTGTVSNEARTTVTVLDWFDAANTQPIISPETLESQRADQAIQAILDLAPIEPLATSLETGDTTFPTVFDGVRQNTTAYSELAKIVMSEWGRLYIKRDRINGETLVFENASHRDENHPVVQVPGLAVGNWEWIDGDDVTWISGETVDLLPEYENLGKITTGYRIPANTLAYGRNITNRAVVRAYPRSIDPDPVVLASSGRALPISAGATIVLQLSYVDPSGGGTKVNALTSSMIQPNPGGTQDTQLRTLLRMADATDATGYNTWTTAGTPGPTFTYGLALDGFNVPIVSGGQFGAYALFDGVDWYMYSSSNDYNFGTGDFTISWWEHRLNINANNDTISRDYSSAFPGFVLGRADGTTMKAYFSSDGSSWDIGDGRDMGPVRVRQWTHYKICRKDGMFYIFVDGDLTDSWYSPAAILTTTNPIAIGRSDLGYCYTGVDDFYVMKGKAEHTRPFTPPAAQRSIYLNEDYWGNTAQDRTGTDITSDLTVSATYGTERATVTITNSGASDGYVFVQTRGRGVYRYNPDERTVESTPSINVRGYRSITVNQVYQESADSGEAIAQTTVDNEADPRTELLEIEFVANRSHAFMAAGLIVGPGDLIAAQHSDSGLNGYFWVQAVDKSLAEGNILSCKWQLQKAYFGAAILTTEADTATWLTTEDGRAITTEGA